MEQYNVMISGRLSEGVDRAALVSVFAEKFKCKPQVAEKLLDGNPRVLKKDVDGETAKKMLAALEGIGVNASAEPVNKIPDVQSEQEVMSSKAVPSTVSKPTRFQGYEFKVDGRPDYSFVTVQVPGGETLKVEGSAMATMDTNMVMKTKMRGGLERLVTGESMFINEFTAEAGQGEIGIAPAAPGDIAHLYLDNEIVYLQNSAFVASAMSVKVETKWQGLTKGFFSGENLFLIRCSGVGDLWFNTYGGMIEIDVNGDYVVDTGNIVAFTDGLDYKVSKVGGYKSLFFSGEGFVCRFSGQGKVWIQTRDVGALTGWVHPFRRKKG